MEEMKKCSGCAEEIKKEAKKCPKCQKDLRNWFVKHWIVSIILGLIVIGIAFWDTETSTETLSETSNTTVITTEKAKDNGTAEIDNSKEKKKVEKVLWERKFYADEFWDKTDDTYISTKNIIRWTFSNSATEDSRLNVKIMVNSADDIWIVLYEYAGKNAVKEYRAVPYSINIKDSKWNKHTIKWINSSEILKLQNSFKLHELLLEGWEMKVLIVNDDTPTSKYNFTIDWTWYWSL